MIFKQFEGILAYNILLIVNNFLRFCQKFSAIFRNFQIFMVAENAVFREKVKLRRAQLVLTWVTGWEY